MPSYERNPLTFCLKYDACEPGREFASKFAHMAEVWDNCENSLWLLWILKKIDYSYNRQKLAAQFVREIWHLLKDERSKAAIEAIEQDRLTDEIRQAANDAAYAANAADAADAAADAAAYAANADARAAVGAVGAAVGAAAADEASLQQMRKKQCEIIRATIPNPFK